MTAATAIICRKVYIIEKKSLRWSLEREHNHKLTRKVFWQSFWYMMAFYATLPFALASHYWRFDSANDVWVLIAVAFIHPSQGFMNAMVYFQRSNKKEFSDLFVVKGVKRIGDLMTGLISSISRNPRKSDASNCTIPDPAKLYTAGHSAQQDSQQQRESLSRSKNMVEDSDPNQSDRFEEEGLVDEDNPRENALISDMSDLVCPTTADNDGINVSETNAKDKDHAQLPPPPPPPPPPPHSPMLAQWVQEDDNRGTRFTSMESQETNNNSEQDVFEATLEYWRINFLSNDDEFHDEQKETSTRPHHESSPRWLSFRKRPGNRDGRSPGLQTRKAGGSSMDVVAAAVPPLLKQHRSLGTPNWLRSRKKKLENNDGSTPGADTGQTNDTQSAVVHESLGGNNILSGDSDVEDAQTEDVAVPSPGLLSRKLPSRKGSDRNSPQWKEAMGCLS